MWTRRSVAAGPMRRWDSRPRRPAPTRAMLTAVSISPPPSAFDHHLDQARAVGLGERLLERGLEACRGVDALGGDAEALGQGAGVDGGVLEVHADRLVVAVEQF